VPLVICSTAFVTLGRAQLGALGSVDTPIAVIPHPFGLRRREEVRRIAEECVDTLVRLATERGTDATAIRSAATEARACVLPVSEELEAFNEHAERQRWSDGLPLVPPTPRRVEAMLRATHRAATDVVALVAPGFGVATVERIAINAVMAGCRPECLPVLIAAVAAMAEPRFNLQGIQATTNPATPWLIVNGPIARELGMNAGINCLGQGNWANSGIGRALRLVLLNLGGGVAGLMDRATQGQPAKYTFCCPENEAENPWAPLSVERGCKPGSSAVTVVATSGTLNMNSHSKDADDILKVFADTLAHPTSNDYWYAGAPFIILAPEHAQVLHRAGLSKADVQRRLWEESKMSAVRLSTKDFTRPEHARASELGALAHDAMIPITSSPELIGIIVAGGPGTHSVYVPGYGNSRPVTREVLVP